jgi:hypothetical protein
MATTMMDVGRGTFASLGGTGALTGTASLLLVTFRLTEANATLQTRATLAAVLAGALSTESAYTNYARIPVTTGVAVSIASHVTKLTMPNQTWASAGGASNEAITSAMVLYKPSSGATDAQCIPLATYDFIITTDGSNLTATIDPVNGLMTAA